MKKTIILAGLLVLAGCGKPPEDVLKENLKSLQNGDIKGFLSTSYTEGKTVDSLLDQITKNPAQMAALKAMGSQMTKFSVDGCKVAPNDKDAPWFSSAECKYTITYKNGKVEKEEVVLIQKNKGDGWLVMME